MKNITFVGEVLEKDKVSLTDLLYSMEFKAILNEDGETFKLTDTTGRNWSNIENEVFHMGNLEKLIARLDDCILGYFTDVYYIKLEELGHDVNEMDLYDLVKTLRENDIEYCNEINGLLYPEKYLINDIKEVHNREQNK